MIRSGAAFLRVGRESLSLEITFELDQNKKTVVQKSGRSVLRSKCSMYKGPMAVARMTKPI
jgi:hypothetical protein